MLRSASLPCYSWIETDSFQLGTAARNFVNRNEKLIIEWRPKASASKDKQPRKRKATNEPTRSGSKTTTQGEPDEDPIGLWQDDDDDFPPVRIKHAKDVIDLRSSPKTSPGPSRAQNSSDDVCVGFGNELAELRNDVGTIPPVGNPFC